MNGLRSSNGESKRERVKKWDLIFQLVYFALFCTTDYLGLSESSVLRGGEIKGTPLKIHFSFIYSNYFVFLLFILIVMGLRRR